MCGQITNHDDIMNFVLAGKSNFTIINEKTQGRFTYRVNRLKDEKTELWFVSVLNGSNNESDYAYIGIIKGGTFRSTQKSKISPDALSVKSFCWLWMYLSRLNKDLPETVKLYHEGICGKCGRKLTVPESIEIGLGPVCASKLGR